MEFDTITAIVRSLSTATSRRGVLAGLTGGLLTALPVALGINETEAKNKKKKGKRKNKKGKRQNQPAPPPSIPPGPVTRVDATCSGVNEGSARIGGDQRLAQTFTALATGTLVRAELDIDKLEESVGDYVLRLSPVDGAGVPTNDVLAETSVSNAAVPDGASTVAFAFTQAATVTAGTEFALVLTRPGSAELGWTGRDTDSCPGLAFVSPDQTTPFVASPSDEVDLIFTTFVNS